jgi:hypothetical protein
MTLSSNANRCNMCLVPVGSPDLVFSHVASHFHRMQKIKLEEELRQNWNSGDSPHEIPSLLTRWKSGLEQ